MEQLSSPADLMILTRVVINRQCVLTLIRFLRFFLIEIGRTGQCELKCWLRVSPQQRESVRAQLFRWNDIVGKWLAGHGVVDDANAPVKSIGWIQQFTEITMSHCHRWYGDRRSSGPSPANPFLPPEKEHFVPLTIETDRRKQHRSAQRVAKLV